MSKKHFDIRLMGIDDFDDVVRIDERVLRVSRPEYYEQKFERLFQSGEYLPTSLVAENDSGMTIGFIMGELYIGEFGISSQGATVDTIGVDPDYRRLGIGELLMSEFIDHIRQLGVQKINTLVDRTDAHLMSFFEKCLFKPSQTVINLERNT